MIDERTIEDVFESGVDLLIGRITSLSECLYGTVEAELNEGVHKLSKGEGEAGKIYLAFNISRLFSPVYRGRDGVLWGMFGGISSGVGERHGERKDPSSVLRYLNRFESDVSFYEFISSVMSFRSATRDQYTQSNLEQSCQYRIMKSYDMRLHGDLDLRIAALPSKCTELLGARQKRTPYLSSAAVRIREWNGNIANEDR